MDFHKKSRTEQTPIAVPRVIVEVFLKKPVQGTDDVVRARAPIDVTSATNVTGGQRGGANRRRRVGSG